jgi:hypothetical protein
MVTPFLRQELIAIYKADAGLAASDDRYVIAMIQRNLVCIQQLSYTLANRLPDVAASQAADSFPGPVPFKRSGFGRWDRQFCAVLPVI